MTLPKYYLDIWLEGLRKHKRNLSQDSQQATGIRIKNLQNTNLGPYTYAKIFNESAVKIS
jgi:hypothetical protein